MSDQHQQTPSRTIPTVPDRFRFDRRQWGLGAAACCILSLAILSGCSPVPQVLTDEAVFGELDALYTAVTSKRRDLLKDCQQRMSKLYNEQRLSDSGHDEVEAIITLCEQDQWSDAAQQLYNFMRGQRKATD